MNIKSVAALGFALLLCIAGAALAFPQFATAQVLPNARLSVPPSPPPGFLPPPLNPNGVRLKLGSWLMGSMH